MSSALGLGIGTPFIQYAGGLPQEDLIQWLLSSDGATTTLDGETVLLDKKGDQTRTLQQGRAYLFDGTNDYIELGSGGGIGSTVIMSAWFNSSSVATEQSIISFRPASGDANEIRLKLVSSKIEVTLIDQGGSVKYKKYLGNTTLSNDTWYKVVAAFDGTNLDIYLQTGFSGTIAKDTPYTKTKDDTFTMTDTTRNRQIGKWTNGGFYFNGSIFGVQIGDYSLDNLTSILEGETLDNSTFNFKCDEQAGAVSYDSSGNENHGTITNATLSTFHANQNVYSWQNEVGYNKIEPFFNGSNSYLSIPDSDDWLSGGSLFSVKADVIFTGSPTADQICGQYISSASIWSFEFSQDLSRIRCLAKSGGSTYANFQAVGLNLQLYTQYSIELRINGTNWGLYVDGDLKASTTATTNTLPNLSSNFEIGRRGSNSHYHDGEITNLVVEKGGTEVLHLTTINGEIVDLTGRHTITNNNVSTLYLPRDESSTDNDVTGTALTYSGRVKYNAALVNSNAATFDGTNDYITIGNPSELQITGQMTIAGRINTTSTASRRTVSKDDASSNRSYLVQITSTGTVKFGIFRSGSFYSVESTGTVNDGADHHYACVNDGSDLKVYIDGVLDNTTVGDGGAVDNDPADFEIGRAGNGTEYLLGTVSDIRVYNTGLSAASISSINNNTFTGSTDLVAYFPLSEGAGAIAYDVSGNDNHGTITNATLATFWGTTQDNFHYNLLEGHSKLMYFDGSNDHITVTATSDFQMGSGDFSYSVDVYLESLPASNNYKILAQQSSTQRALNLAIETTGKINFGIASNGSSGASWNFQQSTSALVPKTHYRITCMRVGTDLRFYINGVLDRTVSSYSLTQHAATKDLDIGYMNFDGTPYYHFPGSIWNVKITKGTLSSADEALIIAGGVPTGSQLKMYLQGYGNTDAFWVDQTTNSNDGTVSGSPTLIRIPALSDGTADAADGTILNPAGNYHNNAETEINQPLAPALIQADITCNKDFWFNSDQTAANDVGYADIVADVATGDEQHVIFADVTTTNEKKNIVTYLIAQAGSALAKIQKYLGIVPVFALIFSNSNNSMYIPLIF